MKKVLLIAVLAIAGVANAQKGSILVAGSVGFGSTSGASKGSPYDFSPKVGYQFNENMTVGLELGFGNTTTTSTIGTTSYDFKTDTTKFGAFLRYAESLGGAFSAYADLGIGVKGLTKSNTVPSSTSTKENGFYIGITPAIGVDLKKGFWLNFSIGGLGYETSKGDWAGAEATNTFGLTFGKQASVGISKNF